MPSLQLKKNLSARELRKQVLQGGPHWKNQKDLSAGDKKTLESNWKANHHIHFSVLNSVCCKYQRDYFDRRRDLPDANDPTVVPKRYQPNWSLSHVEDDDLRRPFSEVSLRQAKKAGPEKEVRRKVPPWNQSHVVTVSMNNKSLHDSQKELFGRTVKPRAESVVPHRVHGLTLHTFPHHDKGNPNGADSKPSMAERLLSHHPSGPPAHGTLGLCPPSSKFGRRGVDPRATV